MVKVFVQATSFAAALALAVPSLAHGQDPKTTGGSSSTTTSTGSVKPTSSGGGDGGSVVSGGKAGGVSQPPSLPPPSSSSSSGGSDLGSYSSRSIRGGSASTSVKSENVQKAPAPGGVAAVIEGQANLSSSSVLSRTRLSGGRGVVDSGGGRDRGNYPLQGYATPRTDGHNTGDFISFPFYGPWGSWYPWVAGGFGWYANYYGYNPWYYSATCWSWNAWGPWLDPYGYCWDPYSGASYPVYAGGMDDEDGPAPAATMGTLRIKANVATAKVYVDSAFAGTVEEFSGLSDHLELDGGKHVIELRADGYKSTSKEIEVKVGKTKTVRLSLKKN